MTKPLSMARAMALAAAVSCFCSRKPAEAAPPPGAAASAQPSNGHAAPAPSSGKTPDPCTLVTAEEVGAILQRKLVSSSSGESCEYGNVVEPAPAGQAAAGSGSSSGSMDDLVKSLSSGTGAPHAPEAVANLTNVKLGIARDDMSEAQVKAIHSRVGKTVRRSLDPDQHGLQGTLVVANDIPGVGDWAFTTSVAAVNMGFGLSSRGRILHARKGPWHLTVGATISPDPGEAALDAQLAAIARTAVARLP